MQLSAVVRTRDQQSRQILTRTAFDIAKTVPQVFLEEQSRMASPISDIVSTVFYGGKLVVASDKIKDPEWKRRRSPQWIGGRELPHVDIRAIEAEWTWSQNYRGPIRYASANAIAELLDDLLGAYADPAEIAVLTPFRAQRGLLRKMLGARRTKGIFVSTVHRSQGSERNIVIFDPVDGGGDFLSGAEGDRLINVAISRAKTHAILFLSGQDRQNPTLQRIAVLAGAPVDDAPIFKPVIRSLRSYVDEVGFPHCLRGKVVEVGETIGEVVDIEKSGQVIVVACRKTGLRRKFATKIVVASS